DLHLEIGFHVGSVYLQIELGVPTRAKQQGFAQREVGGTILATSRFSFGGFSQFLCLVREETVEPFVHGNPDVEGGDLSDDRQVVRFTRQDHFKLMLELGKHEDVHGG